MASVPQPPSSSVSEDEVEILASPEDLALTGSPEPMDSEPLAARDPHGIH